MQGILHSQPECLAVKDLYEILHAHKLPAHCLEKGTDHHIYKGYEHKYGCPPKTWSQEQPWPHIPELDAKPVPKIFFYAFSTLKNTALPCSAHSELPVPGTVSPQKILLSH